MPKFRYYYQITLYLLFVAIAFFAKVEKCGNSVQVYLPHISEPQDAKMYRVVTERESWFNIVMGEKYKVDAASADKYAERIPFPEELARELSFNLEV